LLVGGTMMYFHALRQGLHAMPTADAAVRAAIEQDAAARGWPALHAELAQVDAPTAARLAPNDAQRIQRALEVWRVSGRALSDWHAEARSAEAPAAAQWPVLSLEPASRAWLHGRIETRLRQMVTAGFIEEVHQLRARGDLHLGLPSMRCVGYRQAWQALDQDGLSAFHATALAATRQLAKRQLTWLRSIPDRTVVPCDAPAAPSSAVQQVINAIDCVASKLL
jgi:tRNA dimethylallyltransferase